MIAIEFDGVPFGNLLEIETGASLTALARDFRAVVTVAGDSALPFRGGEVVRILADGVPVLYGYVFSVTPSMSKQSHTVTLTGRSIAADLVDSSLTAFTLASGTSLKTAIGQVIAQLGLPLSVVDKVPGLAPFTEAQDILTAQPGDNAFGFIDKLAKKRQVLLTGDAAGNVEITRGQPVQNDGALINRIGGADGNMLSSQVTYDMTDRFYRYVVMSQKNGAADSFGGSLDAASFVDQRGEQLDGLIRKGRQMVVQPSAAAVDKEAAARAKWLASYARAKSRTYTATVYGLRNLSGELWAPNQLQQVVDEQAGIDDLLLIESVRFLQSRDGGTLTQIGMVDRYAYTLLLAEPPAAQKEDSGFASFS